MMRQNIFIILIFVLLLLLPFLDSIFHFSPLKDLFEKRVLAKRPTLSFSKEYPRGFEEFFDDNYGFRKTLISLNSSIMDKIFNESPDNRAVIGKEGWLYFDNYNSLLDAVGRAEISNKLIERGIKSFYRNWQVMRANNINYLLVIAADKSTIYPEFLPSYMNSGGSTRIDKFLKALKEKYPDFPVLDLRPILLKAKKNEVIYHKTDTHWNMRGAHYAYIKIARMLNIKPNLRKKFINKDDERVRGDISDIMNSNMTNINYDLVPRFKTFSQEASVPKSMGGFYKPYFMINKNRGLPVIFIYKDSYFDSLVGFMSEHFSKAYYVNEFPCDINYKTIKIFSPNTVIQEFWESRIGAILSQCK